MTKHNINIWRAGDGTWLKENPIVVDYLSTLNKVAAKWVKFWFITQPWAEQWWADTRILFRQMEWVSSARAMRHSSWKHIFRKRGEFFLLQKKKKKKPYSTAPAILKCAPWMNVCKSVTNYSQTEFIPTDDSPRRQMDLCNSWHYHYIMCLVGWREDRGRVAIWWRRTLLFLRDSTSKNNYL